MRQAMPKPRHCAVLVVALLHAAAAAHAAGVVADSVQPKQSFVDGLNSKQNPSGVAWDGQNLWVAYTSFPADSAAPHTPANNLAKLSAAGELQQVRRLSAGWLRAACSCDVVCRGQGFA
jgi:hypothetical protein